MLGCCDPWAEFAKAHGKTINFICRALNLQDELSLWWQSPWWLSPWWLSAGNHHWCGVTAVGQCWASHCGVFTFDNFSNFNPKPHTHLTYFKYSRIIKYQKCTALTLLQLLELYFYHILTITSSNIIFTIQLLDSEAWPYTTVYQQVVNSQVQTKRKCRRRS